MSERPLAAASERLKKRPGRPRKDGAVSPQTSGHPSGPAKPALTATSEAAGKVSPETSPIQPRLLDVDLAATYLSLSPWSIRCLIANRTLRRVRVPLPNGGEMRKVLVDRADLDRLVEAWKEAL